jgi:hypothetical protein
MSQHSRARLRALSPFVGFLSFLVLACAVIGTEKNPESFSFTKSYDTLAQFDSVVITLRDTAGRTIDVLYRGKADTVAEIENRPAPHWNGEGIALVSVVGYDSGAVVYHVDKKYNGSTGQVLDTIRIILPGTVVTAVTTELSLLEGDSVPLPAIQVKPLEIKDKSILFTASDAASL